MPSKQQSRSKPILLRILFTAILTVIVLICFEFYLRQTSTFIENRERQRKGQEVQEDNRILYEYTSDGRRLLPDQDVIIHNHTISKLDVNVKSNSLGFRGANFPLEKSSGEKRILFLGDSITIEDYLDEEQTFIKIIENSLNKKNTSSKNWRLINSGVGDIGLKEELDILEERGLQTEPDAIVVNFYLNDSRPPWGFAGELGSRGWWRSHSRIIDAIYTKFELWKWAKDQGAERFAWIAEQDSLKWKNDPADLQKLIDLATYDWGSAWNENSWNKISIQLDRLQEISKRLNIPVLIVAFPVSFQVYSEVQNTFPQQRIKYEATKRGMQYFDLLPVLKKENTKDLFFDQCHPNQYGSKVIAWALEPKIAELN